MRVASVAERCAIRATFLHTLYSHPLTCALAESLYQECDTFDVVVACWWIAFKVEECDLTISVKEICSIFLLTPEQTTNAEWRVLDDPTRRIWNRTSLHAIYDCLPVASTQKYHSWLIALLMYNLVDMMPPDEWAMVLVQVVSGSCVPAVLQTVVYTIIDADRRHHCPGSHRLCFTPTIV